MLQKILAVVLLVCGLTLFIAGVVNAWPRHVAVGAIAFLAGLAVLFYVQAEEAPYCDERTGRYYRFAKDTDNPHHGFCPRCRRRSPIIYTVYGPRYYGIYCEIHTEQWSDLGQPIDITLSKIAEAETARAL